MGTKQVTNEKSKDAFWAIRMLLKKNKKNKKQDIITTKLSSK